MSKWNQAGGEPWGVGRDWVMCVGWFCFLTLVLGACGLFLCLSSSSCTLTVHAFLHKHITPVLLNMWPVMRQGFDQDRNQGTAFSTEEVLL